MRSTAARAALTLHCLQTQPRVAPCCARTARAGCACSESLYCSGSANLLALQYSSQVVIVLVILLVNSLLALTARRLTDFEKHATRSGEARSLAKKLFLAQVSARARQQQVTERAGWAAAPDALLLLMLWRSLLAPAPPPPVPQQRTVHHHRQRLPAVAGGPVWRHPAGRHLLPGARAPTHACAHARNLPQRQPPSHCCHRASYLPPASSCDRPCAFRTHPAAFPAAGHLSRPHAWLVPARRPLPGGQPVCGGAAAHHQPCNAVSVRSAASMHPPATCIGRACCCHALLPCDALSAAVHDGPRARRWLQCRWRTWRQRGCLTQHELQEALQGPEFQLNHRYGAAAQCIVCALCVLAGRACIGACVRQHQGWHAEEQDGMNQ